MNDRVDLQEVLPAWEALRSVAHLAPIRDEQHYDEMVALMDELLDATRGVEDHPLTPLLGLVSELVSGYEQGHYPMPEGTGVDMLRHFMERDGLTQSDVPEIGTQSVVSEVLSGKRVINARMAKALGARFSVSPSIFL